MAAATDIRLVNIRRSRTIRKFPVAASTILYAGTVACLNASGYAVAPANATLYPFVVRETADNSAGAAGAIEVEGEICEVKLENDTGTAVTIAKRGLQVKILDNQTATGAAGSANDPTVRCTEVDADGGIWVDLDFYSKV